MLINKIFYKSIFQILYEYIKNKREREKEREREREREKERERERDIWIEE